MARPRALSSAETTKEPHLVSLKVLRLSKPTLAQQNPLPRGNGDISILSSLLYPSELSDQDFILTPNLTLPPAFGSAHVGETFACALCANNELQDDLGSKAVSGIRITADMQTPTQSVPLELLSSTAENDLTSMAGTSIPKIIRFDLKEEGNHVLAVNVSYTETTRNKDNDQATGGRSRSFRKLYQFIAQHQLSIRTKATELSAIDVTDEEVKSNLRRYVLEAQLENVGQAAIVLDSPILKTKSPFVSRSLNWDLDKLNSGIKRNPQLSPRDVIQVAFLVEQEKDKKEGLEDLGTSLKQYGRIVLGQLSINWQSSMGDRGYLTTGQLMTRQRVAQAR